MQVVSCILVSVVVLGNAMVTVNLVTRETDNRNYIPNQGPAKQRRHYQGEPPQFENRYWSHPPTIPAPNGYHKAPGHTFRERPPRHPQYGPTSPTETWRSMTHGPEPSASYGPNVNVLQPPNPPPESIVTKITFTTAPAPPMYHHPPPTMVLQRDAANYGYEGKPVEFYDQQKYSTGNAGFETHNQLTESIASVNDSWGNKPLPALPGSYTNTDRYEGNQEQSIGALQPSQVEQLSNNYQVSTTQPLPDSYSGNTNTLIPTQPSSFSGPGGPERSVAEFDRLPSSPGVDQPDAQRSYEQGPNTQFFQNAPSSTIPLEAVSHPPPVPREGQGNYPPANPEGNYQTAPREGPGNYPSGNPESNHQTASRDGPGNYQPANPEGNYQTAPREGQGNYQPANPEGNYQTVPREGPGNYQPANTEGNYQTAPREGQGNYQPANSDGNYQTAPREGSGNYPPANSEGNYQTASRDGPGNYQPGNPEGNYQTDSRDGPGNYQPANSEGNYQTASRDGPGNYPPPILEANYQTAPREGPGNYPSGNPESNHQTASREGPGNYQPANSESNYQTAPREGPGNYPPGNPEANHLTAPREGPGNYPVARPEANYQTASNYFPPPSYPPSLAPNTFSSSPTPRYSEPDPTHGTDSVDSDPSAQETYTAIAPPESPGQFQHPAFPGTPERVPETFTYPDSVPQRYSQPNDQSFSAGRDNFEGNPDNQPFLPIFGLTAPTNYPAPAPTISNYIDAGPAEPNAEIQPPPQPFNPQLDPSSSIPKDTTSFGQGFEDITPSADNSIGVQSYSASSDDYNRNQGHELVKYNQTTNGLGYDKHEFETTNGIHFEEETAMVNTGSPNNYQAPSENAGSSIVKRGSYSWIAPNGQKFEVRYTADAFGFHPEGDHIPKSLPV
ncbi:unnamed protein product [Allacma fusca]|uniref:Uncharacterized protein n=1 Tax=Allacma fusca TaxID=39272 RepID=A0A8J2M9M0_9HEXA|nr:unnamed protein product [Allacma fusca]